MRASLIVEIIARAAVADGETARAARPLALDLPAGPPNVTYSSAGGRIRIRDGPDYARSVAGAAQTGQRTTSFQHENVTVAVAQLKRDYHC